jgi:hypothetical protein
MKFPKPQPVLMAGSTSSKVRGPEGLFGAFVRAREYTDQLTILPVFGISCGERALRIALPLSKSLIACQLTKSELWRVDCSLFGRRT